MTDTFTDSRLVESHRNASLTVGTFDELASREGLKIANAQDGCVVFLPTIGRLRPSAMSAAAQALPPHTTPAQFADPAYRGVHGLVALFESSEHVIIAANATLKYPDGSTALAASYRFTLPNALHVTYGQILALAGDFYGDPDQPISDLPTLEARKEKLYQNFQSLAVDPKSLPEAMAILDLLRQEFDAVAGAIRSGRQPSAAYEELGDTLSFRWNAITYRGSLPRPCSNPNSKPCWFPMGRYLDLASNNWDHFGVHALAVYQAGHQKAMELAAAAQTRQDLDMAFAVNAFADHFLTDLFSAGHLRTPRKEMYDDASNVTPGFIPSFLSRIMHDEDSRFGLWVGNARGDNWVAFGDKRYRDSADFANAKIVQKCVQQSMDDVFDAARTRSVPAVGTAAVFAYIPNLSVDWTDRRNFAPLFHWEPDKQQVFRRTDISARGKLNYNFIPAKELAHPSTWNGFTYMGTWQDFGYQTDGPPLEGSGGAPSTGTLPPATGHEIGLTGAPPFGTPTGATGQDIPRLPWGIIGATGA